MKKRIIIIFSILIIAIVTICAFYTTSNGYTVTANGLKWYYEVSSGEAINVYVYSGVPGETVTIPSTLGGYPVTSITGYRSYNYSGGYVTWSIFRISNQDYINNITTVVIPETVETIYGYSFYNCTSLKTINLPESLQSIGIYAFQNTALESIEIPSDVITIGEYAFNKCENLKSVKIGDSVTTIGSSAFANCTSLTNLQISNSVKTISDSAFANCTSLADLQIPSSVTTIGGSAFSNCTGLTNIQLPSSVTQISRNSFAGQKDIYIDNTKANVKIAETGGSNNPYIHFNDCKHNISANTLEGVKIINVATNEEITSNDFGCGDDVTFKVEQKEGYNYQNLKIYIETQSEYYGKSSTIEEIDLDIGESYTFSNLNRNKTIYVQNVKEGLDLALRQYISTINDKSLSVSRRPSVKVINGKIQYQHRKDFVYPQTGDKIIYNIRVYNEGTVTGTANKITQYLPEGIEFDKESETNEKYGWTISEDGRVATTEYLKTMSIAAYTGANNISYKEISIECIVNTNDTDEYKRLVNIAEITEESEQDIDSTPGNITAIVDSSYMEEESENSGSSSYLVGTEDDNDFEVIYNKQLKYSLKLEKIDGLDNQLLNGATFELLDSDKNVIKTGVTANNGILDFGLIESDISERKTYYIRELHTPEGYKNTIKYLIKIDIIGEKQDATTYSTKVECDIEDIDVDTSKYKTIEISSKEGLLNIKNNQSEKYILTNDIDMQGENWTPLNVENVMLDGNGHKISNLKIESDNSTTKKFGLFGTYSGIIENLTLENVDIDITENTDDDDDDDSEENINAVGSIIGYSNGVIIKNCNVTGAINTSVDNVGGLIGHSKKGTMTAFVGSTNEVNVSVDGNNAGGLIGCGLGPVYIRKCTNKGNITVSTYNAGGMVGCVEADGYELKYVSGTYNDETNGIDISIKNEKINGEYSIQLQKVDATENLNLLDGAIFSIYDKNKNLISGYENVELENGSIKIPKTIDTVGTDTYYIKEIKAPEGYNQITNNYIKLEIEKTWDENEEKYVAKSNVYVLSDDEYESDTAKEENTSTVASGSQFIETGKAEVTWKINKVYITEDSVNEGTIITNYQNAGGLIGRAKCNIMLTNVKNNGTVVSVKGNTGGLVAQAQNKDDETSELYINNCNNYGKIIQNTGTEAYCYSNAGIVAYVDNDTEIYNTNNYGEINGYDCSLGGIVGMTDSEKMVIDNCKNEGILTLECETRNQNVNICSSSGGIVAKSFIHKLKYDGRYYSYEDSNVGELQISNCANKASIEGGAHSAGILGYSDIKKVDITNCTSENTDISIYASCDTNIGGIAGYLLVENINIKNCIVNSGTFENERASSLAKFGGIVGGVYSRGWKTWTGCNAYITNCNVSDITINNNEDSAGIVGMIEMNYVTGNATISECNCTNVTVNIKAKSTTYGKAAGILGSALEVNNLSISKCTVDKSSIILSPESEKNIGSDFGAGGICALVYSPNNTVVISDCKFENSSIKNNAYGDGCSNTGGCIAFAWTNNCIINNVEVNDSSIYSRCGNSGGLIGDACASYNNNNSSVGIYNSQANNLDILNEAINAYSGSSYSSGSASDTSGILATSNMKTTTIANCIVKDTNVKGRGYNIGGIAACPQEDFAIYNCEVNNSKIEDYYDYSQWGSRYVPSVGGIVGGASYGGSATIESCKFINNSQIISKAYSTGGIIGWAYYINSIKNCTVENATIQTGSEQNTSNTGSVGGIVGDVSSTITNPIEGCQIINTNITSTSDNIGGIIGVPCSSCTVNNAYIKGVKITYTNEVKHTSSPKAIGGVIAVSLYNPVIQSSQIEDLTITANSGQDSTVQTGGYIGYTEGLNINNVSANGITINNNTTQGNAGGILSINQSKETTITNISKYSNINITCNSNAGGMIGYSNPSVTISGIAANNLEITTASGNAGGLVGIVTSSAEFTGVTINKSENGTNIITGGTQNTGILLGYGIVTTNDINISDVTINGAKSNSTGTIGMVATGSNVKDITLNNVSMTGNTRVGLIAGQTQANISSCTVSNSTITGTYEVGGIAGNASVGTTSITSCTVSNSEINGNSGHLGGIAGFAANTISSCNVSDTTITTTETGASGTGGIVGHGSNIVGTDTYIKNCNVYDSNITGYEQVGGISGGAVAKIESCYVGGKKNETFEEGEYAVTIKGNANVGGIIGDAGVISGDTYVMLTMQGTNISNSLIEGTTNVDELIGLHNSFSTSYTTGTQEETVTLSTATDCKVNVISQ